MLYDAIIASVRSVLETHNSRATNPAHKVDIDSFFNKLSEQGGTTEEALAAASWEDIRKCNVPDILARQICSILRKSPIDNSTSSKYISTKGAERLDIADLVAVYDPRDPENPVGKRLSSLSKGKPFIVFLDDGSVDKTASLKLLNELRDGLPPRDKYVVDGLPREVYVVGQRPDNYAEVNPLFPNDVLRSGECININKSWSPVSLATRQLIYLGRKNGELKVNGLKDAISIHADAISDNGFKTIASYAPKAAIEFKRLQDLGTLPAMKTRVVSNNPVEVPRRNDPFGGVRKPHQSF